MSVFACGFAKLGQLGIGQPPGDIIKTPSLIEAFKGKKIVQVECREQTSFAVTNYGDLWAWGRGREGQLGQGNRVTHHTPVKVTKLAHEKVIKVCCGNNHTAALTETGRVYVWGKLIKVSHDKMDSEVGKLSNLIGLTHSNMILSSQHRYLSGEQDDELHQKDLMETFVSTIEFYQLEPKLVEGALKNKKIIDIAAGYSFTLALADDGRVYSWGVSDKGQLGHGNRYNLDEPKLINGLLDVFITKIVCGHNHSLALTSEGQVWSWGMGVFGQLGHGNSKDYLSPHVITEFLDDPLFEKQVITDISCGSYHSVAITDQGIVYSWGHGEYGQHGGTQDYKDWGTGEKENHYLVPRRLAGIEEPVFRISCGSLHNCAITVNGDCYSWGWGASGCLGHGDTRFKLIPQQIIALKGEEIISVSCAWKHTLFVKKASDSTFALDYEPFVNNISYSDLIYVVEGRPIYCHKALIFSRCEYLSKRYYMALRFCSQVLDYSSRNSALQIKITGVTYPVFLGLIQYLYTDHLKIAPHQVYRLRDVAMKFGLPRLAEICKRALSVQEKVREADDIIITPSSFADDVRGLVSTPEFADFRFITKGKDDGQEREIHCHKVMLISRSAYFQKLFQGGFRESISTEIILDQDISYQTMLSIIEFIYTGDENILNGDNTVDILMASDRFDIDDLKQICEDIIEQNLDVENVCWILELADRYNAPRLTRSSFELISSSKETLQLILETDGFKNLCKFSPQLLRAVDHLCAIKNLSEPGQVIRSQR